jgi:nicotinate-nucleotide pyrophosphorylase (carboxylating)
MKMTNEELLDSLIDLAIREDTGDGDHSSLASIPEGISGRADLLVKDRGIIAGIRVAFLIFRKIDPGLVTDIHISDGEQVSPGVGVFTVSGPARSILLAERLVLNVMQRMSGIATRTAEYVAMLEGLPARILDTRKTAPGLRILDKEAVRIGGGLNHRMGLYDMIMLKDNHIDLAGGIGQAIHQAVKYLEDTGRDLDIEIEARSLEDVRCVMDTGHVRRILLDNFSIEDTRKAVEMIGGRFETESSGGITLENLRDYAECGVDFISVGALTHHVHGLDLSLKAKIAS